jgi:glycine dehydrogenase subunit 1
MSLAATIYLSLLGKQGYVELAHLNHARAEYAKAGLTALDGVELAFEGPTFNEFTLRLARPAAEVVAHAAKQGIAAGIDLGRFDPSWSNLLLVAVTEMVERADIDALVSSLAQAT